MISIFWHVRLCGQNNFQLTNGQTDRQTSDGTRRWFGYGLVES